MRSSAGSASPCVPRHDGARRRRRTTLTRRAGCVSQALVAASDERAVHASSTLVRQRDLHDVCTARPAHSRTPSSALLRWRGPAQQGMRSRHQHRAVLSMASCPQAASRTTTDGDATRGCGQALRVVRTVGTLPNPGVCCTNASAPWCNQWHKHRSDTRRGVLPRVVHRAVMHSVT